MRRRATLRLASSPAAPRAARVFVADHLRGWALDGGASVAELLTSELVTNVVLHAHTDLEVHVSLTAGVIEVAVSDGDLQLPLLRPSRLDLLGDLDTVAGTADGDDDRDPSLHVGSAGSVLAGRGLLVVATTSDEWGVTERPDGKEVWFRLAVPPE